MWTNLKNFEYDKNELKLITNQAIHPPKKKIQFNLSAGGWNKTLTKFSFDQMI